MSAETAEEHRDALRAARGRRASVRVCSGCRASIITGPDADTCAFPAITDARPTTALGEYLACLSGRMTYDLVEERSGQCLYRRNAYDVAHDPITDAGLTRRGYPVHVEHRCGMPLPVVPQSPPEILREESSEHPPY